MSASEKLKAMEVAWREAVAFHRSTDRPFLQLALPQILAVVEAAEKPRMEELVVGGYGEFCRLCENPTKRHRKTCPLSALDEALS